MSRPGWGYSKTGSCSSMFIRPISSGSAPWLTRYTTSWSRLVPTRREERARGHSGIWNGRKRTMKVADMYTEYNNRWMLQQSFYFRASLMVTQGRKNHNLWLSTLQLLSARWSLSASVSSWFSFSQKSKNTRLTFTLSFSFGRFFSSIKSNFHKHWFPIAQTSCCIPSLYVTLWLQI